MHVSDLKHVKNSDKAEKMFKDQFCLVTSCNTSITLYIILVILNYSNGITTTHYDKLPLEKSIPIFQNSLTGFPNLTAAERQKRLLPYINFYVSQNLQSQNGDYYYVPEDHFPGKFPVKSNNFNELFHATYQPDKIYQQLPLDHQSKTKFTPFLETNALPGPFIPMLQPQTQKIKLDYTTLNQREKVPNYSAIYDKFSQIKLQQDVIPPQSYGTPRTIIQYFQRKPQINYIPVQEFQETHTSPKTYIHTYTPTSIDLPTQENNYHSQELNNQNQIILQHINKPTVGQKTPHSVRITQLNNPKHHLTNSNIKPSYAPLITANLPTQYVLQEPKSYHNQNHNQFLQEVVPSSKPLILLPQKEYPTIIVNNQIKERKPYILIQSNQAYTTEIPSNHQNPPPPLLDTPKTSSPIPSQEPPNSLSVILKKLQDSNALPQTLTADNIDNSIKTLINILNSYKKGQKLSRPIIVADLNDGFQHDDESGSDAPESISQTFPANTPEGGTPGRPGVDYPILSHIPQTNFDCQTQRYKGFFADPATSCQVWHYCDLNGGQASFLCPNGTIFSQVALTCDWWFNVKCSTTTQLYVLNERLYKYIIPLKPKFPEDYTGPLVDRYIALKFQEMEEKLRKEKKENEKNKNEEIDELQLLEEQNLESASHTPEPLKSHK